MWVGSLGWEDSLEKVTGNPFQYSCLQNPMDRGAWQTAVHGITKTKQSSEVDCSQLIAPILQLGKMELRKMR